MILNAWLYAENAIDSVHTCHGTGNLNYKVCKLYKLHQNLGHVVHKSYQLALCQ